MEASLPTSTPTTQCRNVDNNTTPVAAAERRRGQPPGSKASGKVNASSERALCDGCPMVSLSEPV